MTEVGSIIMQMITIFFLLFVAISGTVRALNLKASWYECFLVIGSITSFIWAINV